MCELEIATLGSGFPRMEVCLGRGYGVRADIFVLVCGGEFVAGGVAGGTGILGLCDLLENPRRFCEMPVMENLGAGRSVDGGIFDALRVALDID